MVTKVRNNISSLKLTRFYPSKDTFKISSQLELEILSEK